MPHFHPDDGVARQFVVCHYTGTFFNGISSLYGQHILCSSRLDRNLAQQVAYLEHADEVAGRGACIEQVFF